MVVVDVRLASNYLVRPTYAASRLRFKVTVTELIAEPGRILPDQAGVSAVVDLLVPVTVSVAVNAVPQAEAIQDRGLSRSR